MRARKSSAPGWFSSFAPAQRSKTRVVFILCSRATLKNQGGFHPLLPRNAQKPGWFSSFAPAQRSKTRVVFILCSRAMLKNQGGFHVLLPRNAQKPGWFSSFAPAQSPKTRVVFNICEPAGVRHQGDFLLLQKCGGTAAGMLTGEDGGKTTSLVAPIFRLAKRTTSFITSFC